MGCHTRQSSCCSESTRRSNYCSCSVGSTSAHELAINSVFFFKFKFIANWHFAEDFFYEIKKLLHLCWDLNPRLPAYEASALTTILTLQVRLKGVKFVLNKACLIILQGGNLH